MSAEQLARAQAVGLPADWAGSLLRIHGTAGLQTAIDCVNRGLPIDVVKYVKDIDFQLLELCAAVQIKKQLAAPLGSWSAMVSGGVRDPLGAPARAALAAAVAACR